MNAASQRRLTPLLVTMAIVLALVLLVLISGFGRKVQWNAPRPRAPLPPVSHASNLPTPQSLQSFSLVWQRPLFSPDRKPTAARVADGGTSLGDLSLTGIIIGPMLHMALLHDKNGDKQIRLHEGESTPDGSVKLVEVRPRSALFDGSGGRTELKLPAGAPFDTQKGDASAAAGDDSSSKDNDNAQVPAGAVISVGPQGAGRQGGADDSATSSRDAPSDSPLVNRIRQANQRRRAERAAASH